MRDFRPISLVGSLYNVLSKVLANRMKMVMNLVIGETQMAFVENRQIVDSFDIAEEIVHKWKRDRVRGLLVKLDFEKAYDSVDHLFLDDMMSTPWKKKIISKGGRLVLIKVVLASIPNYYMSVLRMPVGVVKKIEKIQQSFFWGDGVEKRKIHLVGWDSICNSKKKSGLRVASIMDKSMSFFLAKWVWRFGNEANALWKRVLNAKYGVSGRDLSWNWGGRSSPSPFVKAVQSLFEKGSKTGKILQDGMKSKQCVLCNLEDETVNHQFFHCKWTWEMWLKGETKQLGKLDITVSKCFEIQCGRFGSRVSGASGNGRCFEEF
ncbi:hypothetical protein Ddye_031259 [Dipteronia dyeriana]|uniref:Reverse transcriptase domain-containing protein n=1 Tax=Dipteronia dyeriana TaxID=168575 RepID=A0AAD9WNB0_9ROSI|nr:hypothetical protein Ddye_031259 [Dipteronia dyeriana]